MIDDINKYYFLKSIMTYAEFQDYFNEYQDERGWGNQAPVDLVKSIIIEAAELLEHFQWDETSRLNYNKEKSIENKNIEAIKDEIGDIAVYLNGLCRVLGIDLIETTVNKLEKVKKKYPAKEIQLDSDNGFYKKRKNEYRGK